jgi:hypothetical protein
MQRECVRTNKKIGAEMKKIAVLAFATALALALVGCGSSSAPSSSASSEESPSVSDVAESSSSASESSESASSQSVDAIAWNDVKTADDAAKGAGFDKFGVMDKITIDDVEYSNPAFSYAGGVAQAMYEKGAIGIIVRKADGKHDVPLTDRDTTEFAQKWAKSYENLDVTLYGPAKGAATVITWSDGTQDFGVTYQGLGGEEVTLDSDEVDAIVKGLKEANTKEQPKKEDKADQSDQNDEGDESDESDDDDDSDESSAANMTISQGDAEAAAEGASGGTTVNSYQGYVDACAIAEDASGGKATNAYPEQTENHGLCWHVTTEDDNGNVIDYHVDNDGNAFNIEFE